MEYKKLTKKFGLWVLCEEDGLILDRAISERFNELFTSQIWSSQRYADEWCYKPDTRLALVMDALSAAEQLMQQSHEEILGTAGVFQEPVWVFVKERGQKPRNVLFPSEYLHKQHTYKPANDVPALVSSQSWNSPCDEINSKGGAENSLLGCVPLFEPVWFDRDLMSPDHEFVPSCLNKSKPPLGEIVVVDPMRGDSVLEKENQGDALSEVFNVLSWASYIRLCRQRLNVHWDTARGSLASPERDPLEFRRLTQNGYMPK